jgi:hypothetical protein
VGVSVATTKLQTYWDKMGVEKQRGRKWSSGEEQVEVGCPGL